MQQNDKSSNRQHIKWSVFCSFHKPNFIHISDASLYSIRRYIQQLFVFFFTRFEFKIRTIPSHSYPCDYQTPWTIAHFQSHFSFALIVACFSPLWLLQQNTCKRNGHSARAPHLRMYVVCYVCESMRSIAAVSLVNVLVYRLHQCETSLDIWQFIWLCALPESLLISNVSVCRLVWRKLMNFS